MNDDDDGAGSYVTYKIFSLIPGIFRPGRSPWSSCQIGSISQKLSNHRSVFWAAVILSWQRAEALSSISPLSKHGHSLRPHTPPRPVAPCQFTITETERAKLEEKRIRMGNLPVIPRTAAKRAICLINSLFCRSPSGPHPSSRPSVRHLTAESARGEVKGSLGVLWRRQTLSRSFKEFIFILQMYCQLLLTGRVALFADSGGEKNCVLDASRLGCGRY